MQYYAAQLQLATLLAITSGKTDSAISINNKLTKCTYPWEDITSLNVVAENSVEDAIKKYEEMKKAGTLDDVRNVASNGVFEKYDQPVPDRKKEAPRHEY